MTIFDIEVKDIAGHVKKMSDYRGKVLLIVNVASECGFTSQYEGLEALSRKYRDRGLVVMGFPCNQFGGQEPGSESQIQQFCESKFQVSFPLFSKVEVNGPSAHPLFQHLKSECKGILGTEAIKWNFTKFLVDRSGHVLQRFAPQTAPKDMAQEIEKLIET
ncbi:MAG: glutathione peroxidase [Bdellovibrionia bacterium]